MNKKFITTRNKNMSQKLYITEKTGTKTFSWKLFGIVLLLVALGALAKVPAAIYVEGLTDKSQVWLRVTGTLFTQDFFILGLFPVAIGIGLMSRLGFDLPILKNLTSGKSAANNFGKFLRIALISGLTLAIVGVFMQRLTKPMIVRDLTAYGVSANFLDIGTSPAPWWAMLLLSFSAGVTEEVAFRLGLLTFVAWLGSLIWKPRENQVRPAVFWTANIIIALLFGLAHFSNFAAAGVPLVPGLIIRALAGNGLAALTFGWLFWKYGLESAIMSHAILDVMIYVVVPILLPIIGLT
jgi:membrane protease YdiL (CAAX protease family)